MILTMPDEERDEALLHKQATRKRAYLGKQFGDCRILFPDQWKRTIVAQSTTSAFRWLFDSCCKSHPDIEIDPKVLGGIPHIRKTRLSVGQILGRLYVLGSIKAVAKYYAPGVDEKHIKEAIAYAQDFMELAGDPISSEVND